MQITKINDMSLVRFVSWSAVSSRPQAEKESLTDQRRLNREFVANLGKRYPGHVGEIVADLEVVGSRSIVDLSDAVATYPAYARLIGMVRGGEVDAVVCRSRDRLGRTDALTMTIERLCLWHGVVVVPRQSPPTTLDAGTLARSEHAGLGPAIEGFLAQSAVRRLVNENKRGMLARVKVQRRFPSNLPWGYLYRYSPDGDPLVVIDHDAAEAIREVFRLYTADHLNRREIAERMNDAGHKPARGSVWTENIVKNVLGNAATYAGYITLNRRSRAGRPFTQVSGDHEPIITAAVYQATQGDRRTRAGHRMGRGRPFSGVVYCLACNKPLSSQVQYYRADGERVPYYRLRCTHCRPQHSIAEHEIEEVLIGAIDRLAQSGDLSSFYGAAREGLAQAGRAVDDAERLAERLADVERRRQRLLELYVSRGDINPAHFGEEMDRLGREDADLRARMAATEERPADDVDAAIERLRQVRDLGRAILENRDADPRGAQLWLAQCVRVYVRPEDGGTVIDNVRFL